MSWLLATSGLGNMTDTIITLLSDVIPIFVVIGVFGAVLSYIGKMSKGLGN